MRRVLLVLFFVLALGAIAAAPASAKGPNPAQLGKAGWTCFDVPSLGVHCLPPGKAFGDVSVPVLYFDTADPNATNAPFKGTELLLRADHYHGQPCPTEGIPHYHGLDLDGDGIVDYYACHRR
jgi:hypothetical protein